MKLAAVLLLAPVIALAQQPPQGAPRGGQIDQAEILKQMQQHMLPVLQETLPKMREARECVAATNNKEDLAACAESMRQFQQQMMAKMAPPGAAGQPAPPPPEETPEVEWSPEIKQQIVTGLDQSIAQGTAMQGCLETSATPGQMDACVKASGIGGAPAQ